MTTIHTRQLTTIHTRLLKIQHVQKVNNTKVRINNTKETPYFTNASVFMCAVRFRINSHCCSWAEMQTEVCIRDLACFLRGECCLDQDPHIFQKSQSHPKIPSPEGWHKASFILKTHKCQAPLYKMSSGRVGSRELCTCDLDVLKTSSLQVAIRSIPVVSSSKVWVCGRLLAGIVGSNPAGGMDVCLL